MPDAVGKHEQFERFGAELWPAIGKQATGRNFAAEGVVEHADNLGGGRPGEELKRDPSAAVVVDGGEEPDGEESKHPDQGKIDSPEMAGSGHASATRPAALRGELKLKIIAADDDLPDGFASGKPAEKAVDTGNGADPSTAVVDAQLTATDPSKPIPADSSWHASGTSQVTVAGNVPLAELGTTRIELTATVGFDQRKVVLEAALAAAAADGGAAADSVLTLRKVLDTSETGGEAFQAVGLYAGIAVEVDGPGDGPSGSATDGTGSYSVEVSPSGEEMGISCATLSGVGLRAVPRVDVFGVTHFESVMTDVPACSASYSVFPGSGAQADVLIDARFFQGALRFVDRQGNALPPVCAGMATERDAASGEIERISRADAETTEVHFFRESD